MKNMWRQQQQQEKNNDYLQSRHSALNYRSGEKIKKHLNTVIKSWKNREENNLLKTIPLFLVFIQVSYIGILKWLQIYDENVVR